MTSDEQGYNGWKNWDTWETNLVLTNTQGSYKWLLAWKKNFERKMDNGTFDRDKARLVVRKYIVPAARGKGAWPKVWGSDFVADPSIDPNKVDADEIIDSIIELGD